MDRAKEGGGGDGCSAAFILGSSREERLWHLRSLLAITIESVKEICKKTAGRENF